MASEPNGQGQRSRAYLRERLALVTAIVGLVSVVLGLVTLIWTGIIPLFDGNGDGTPSRTPAVEGSPSGTDLSGRWYERYDRASDFWDFTLQDASSNTYEYVAYESNGDQDGAGIATVEQNPSGLIIIRMVGQGTGHGAFRADMTLTNDVLEVKETFEGGGTLPSRMLFRENVVPE